jgi:hypothetical protein
MLVSLKVSPARRAPALRARQYGTVRVEVLRLPLLTLFALEDNQSVAQALEPTGLSLLCFCIDARASSACRGPRSDDRRRSWFDTGCIHADAPRRRVL